MRTVSGAFATKDIAQVRTPVLDVTIAPNREALDWALLLDNVGPDMEAYFSAHLTSAGTLIRSWASGFVGTVSLNMNRIVDAAGDPTEVQLETLSTVTADMRGTTREAWASSGSTVRLFYVRATDGAIVYKESADDGVTFGAAVVIDNSTTWSVTALAAVSTTLVFACRRRTDGSGDLHWLDIVAFDFRNSAWVRVDHPKGTPHVRLADTSSISEFWDAPFQFDAAWIDESQALAGIVFIDDLAGRPSATRYQRRFWGDMTPIESIDFSEPERDELIGLRMRSINGLLVLHGRRTLADSDFVSTQQGVLYFSPDGIAWSEAYLTLDESDWNWGIPFLYRDYLHLIGSKSLWKAEPTSLWGGIGQSSFGLTPLARTVALEESAENVAAATARVDCANDHFVLNSHPYLVEGAELTINAGWESGDLETIFQGAIEKPRQTVTGESNTLAIQGYDVLSQIKEGVADRALVFPQPLRRAWEFDNAAELGEWTLSPSSSWAWYSSSGDGMAEAIAAGRNLLLVGTGLEGAIGIMTTLRLNNPEVGVVTGGANSDVTAEIVFAMNPEKTTYYSLKCGSGITRFQLYRVVNGSSTLLATSNVSYSDVPINREFNLMITQFQQTLIVGFWYDGSPIYELIRYFDETPIYQYGICGVAATIPVKKPVSGDFDTVRVSSFLFFSHEPEWLAEQYLRALAVKRGVRNLSGSSILNKDWTALGSDWEFFNLPTPDPYITQGPSYFAWNGNTSAKTTIWHTTFDKQDFIVDVDMQLGFSNNVSDGWFGQAGISCRFNSLRETGVEFSVGGSYFGGSVRQSFMQVIVRDYVSSVPTIVSNIEIPTLIPIHVGDRTTFRFVVTGPWYSLYVNGLHAGTIYSPLLIRSGRFGFMNANGGGIIWNLRVPTFNLGSWPVIKPNEPVDRAFYDTMETYNGWAVVSGDTVAIGNDTSNSSSGTITDELIYQSQTSGSTELLYTHVRVVSTDQDGVEISGTVYSPSLWRKVGRARWKIEDVDGLRNEQECRDRAWATLIEQERHAKERDYQIPMRLRWEKRDTFQVSVPHDDTDALLTVMSMRRTWTKEQTNNVWQTDMAVLVQDKLNETLDRSTERQPT